MSGILIRSGFSASSLRVFRRRIIAGAMAAVPVAGYAVGLGAVAGDPVLGEALRLEVPLTGSGEKPVDDSCIEVHRSAGGVSDEYYPRDLSIRLEQSGGNRRLLLTTRSVIRQPVVEFRILVTCGYNVARDYLLLASPRSVTVAAEPPKAAPGPAPSAPAPAADAGSFPDGMGAKPFVVDKEMTLADIARLHFPGPLRRERFIRWVVEANPRQFAGAADPRSLRLASGTRLWIPDGVPPRRPADNAPARNTPSAPPPKAAAVPTEAPRREPEHPAEKGKRKDRLVIGGGLPARSLKETAEMVDRLTAMLEQQVAAETAAQEKIHELETALAELSKTVTAQDAVAKQREAKLRAEWEAERRVRAEQEQRNWWQLPVAILAGGLLGAGLLHWLRTLLARRRADSAEGLFSLRPWAKPADKGEPSAPAGVSAASVFASAGNKEADFLADDDDVASLPKPAVPAASPATRTADAPAATVSIVPPFAASAADESLSPDVHEVSLPALELVDMMVSIGLTEQAIVAIEEYLLEYPIQSVEPWIRLLSLLAKAGKRTELEQAAGRMHRHFELPLPGQPGMPASAAAGGGPRQLAAGISRRWPTAACTSLLAALLGEEGPDGPPPALPAPLVDDILLLLSALSERQPATQAA